MMCIVDGYIGAICCYYSSTLGCAVAISRKRHYKTMSKMSVCNQFLIRIKFLVTYKCKCNDFYCFKYNEKKVSCILRCILLQVIARHRIGNYFYVINQPYSSTLGCAVAISRKRPCAFVSFLKIFLTFFIFCVTKRLQKLSYM